MFDWNDHARRNLPKLMRPKLHDVLSTVNCNELQLDVIVNITQDVWDQALSSFRQTSSTSEASPLPALDETEQFDLVSRSLPPVNRTAVSIHNVDDGEAMLLWELGKQPLPMQSYNATRKESDLP